MTDDVTVRVERTYLTEPFSFTMPGVATEKLEPVQEDGETLRRLRVVFPDNIATHSKENLCYVDAEGAHPPARLRVRGPRCDRPAAHYSSAHREFDEDGSVQRS